jgi:Soluble lytic murein transglycosylase and related regulatory proteins (some contain LysM/invasin domains)
MTIGRRILAAIIAGGAVLIMALPAAAASWSKVRDAVMVQRERGNFAVAYSTAANYGGKNADEIFDSQFLAGWIALRNLNRPDVAIKHFGQMAQASAQVRGMRNASKAQAGYWLGRALTAAGKKKEAETIYRAAANYANTFYGQLAAAELGIGLHSSMIAGVAHHYPTKDFYWHDQRARKELVLAIMREESNFRTRAVSNKGAQGLMQVMPGTAKMVGKNAGVNIDLRLLQTNPDYNVAVGSKYLADQITRYRGNAMLAAAAYNAGPGNVDNWLRRFGDPRGGRVDPVDWVESIPFGETRNYVKKVIGSYITYMALAYNRK